jgi:hypothetical protein
MVKDGWSTCEQTQDSNSYSTGNIFASGSHTSYTNGLNQYQQHSTPAQEYTTPGLESKDVWGVYESKEKLMEMHIC